jgi:hypothetical protein
MLSVDFSIATKLPLLFHAHVAHGKLLWEILWEFPWDEDQIRGLPWEFPWEIPWDLPVGGVQKGMG